MPATVGKKGIMHPFNGAPRDVVAIPFVSRRIDECLGVGESHRAAGAAARFEDRILIRRVRLVEQDRRGRPRGNHQIPSSLQKQTVGLHANHPPYVREPLDRLLHWRYRPRLELPAGHFAVTAGRRGAPLHASDDGGGAPCLVDIVSALPSPWIPRSVYRIA